VHDLDAYDIAAIIAVVLIVLLVFGTQVAHLLDRDRGGPRELGKRLARTRVVTGGRR
jgi:hypothetical protein